MSKGSSHLFSGTSGEGKALIDEVIANGYKISPEKVVLITLDPTGKIVWLEEGNSSSGLQHIIDRHGHEFNGKGIANSDIPDYVLEAVYQGNIVGTQGKRNPPRTVYEFVYNGQTQRIAIQVGSNGYIVGANPKSMKEH
jgi:filamentous hemagglutinin